MAVVNLGSSSIYDPNLPNRILSGGQQAPPQPDATAPAGPGQGPQYNPSFGADTSPQATSTTGMPNYPPSFLAGDYAPSPLGSALASAAQPPAARNMPFPGQVDPRGVFAPAAQPPAAARNMPFPGQRDPRGVFAPRPAAVASRAGPAAGPNVNGVFDNLPANAFDGANNVQTAQAPASATPQGWNLFTAIGQALGHLLGYNAQGQPQGMSGLVRNPVQAAPTTALRMPTPQEAASRYQGRTLLG